jgi:basic membrane protein A
MDGFSWGVDHYNSVQRHRRDGSWLGPGDTREGLFTNNFESLDDGRAFAQNLYDEGADIVLPVAGPVGLGSAALADELGTDELMIIGVDADLYLTDPERGHVYLTSIMKRMDATVFRSSTARCRALSKAGSSSERSRMAASISRPSTTSRTMSPGAVDELVGVRKAGIIDGSISMGGM